MPERKRRNIKKHTDIKNEEPYIAPSITKEMECMNSESLMFFSYATRKQKKYRMFYGIGIVYRVVKGDKQDLVYVNFGLFKEKKTRLVVAYDNHARRQILTLKRGQVCHIYGLCRYFTTDVEINGIKAKGIRLGLYAKGIQGWYVPTMLDIRKMPINDDLVDPSEKEQELMDKFDDVLNEFMTGKGEE